MKICAFGAALAAAGGVAWAGSTNLIQNGGFEQSWDIPTSVGYLTVYSQQPAIEHWDIVRGSVDLVGWWPQGDLGFWSEWFWESTEGSISLDLAGLSSGAVAQTVETVVGQEYLLEFDLGGNWGGDETIKVLELGIGDTVHNFEFDITNSERGLMRWQGESLAFVASSGFTTIRFGDVGNVRFGAAIDNVRLTAVPAPGIAALGLAGLLAGGRRRRTR